MFVPIWRRSIPAAAQNKCPQLVSRWFTNPGVSIRGDREKRISLQSNGPIAAVRLVSTRNKFRQQGISRRSREATRGCDTDGSTTVRVRDRDEGELAGEMRDVARRGRGKESSSCFREKCRCTPRRGRNTRATGERQVSSTSFISQRLVSARAEKNFIVVLPRKTVRRASWLD